MDLRIMRYFIAVAEELSFSRAADRLQMAQPPLSQEIRKLEDELGVTLFHRTKRQVKLSNAGKVFLEGARRTLSQAEATIQSARLANEGKIGEFAIGFVDSTEIVMTIIKKFRERFPNVQLILHEMTTAQQLQALDKQEIQVGFTRSVSSSVLFSSETCMEESLRVVLPEDHPLAAMPNIPLQLLADESFIMFPRYLGTNLYDLIVSYFWGNGVSMKIVQEAVQMHTIVNLVAAGMGISVVPSSMEGMKRSGVVFKKLQETTPRIMLFTVWKADEASCILDLFLATVREVTSNSITEFILD
ncbi:LysR substrate-binding domain-containing protein [Brevibacillus sp. NRS-1366]|uniref:LysR substrate-binding domain-containing protein n=1 Tax=Brevibacillus sp. NRS-1366 TaxID=3233899 RepID=UPI003D206CF5